MRFAGFLKQSFVDYPGKIAAVLFTRGCNMRCSMCHNGHLLTKTGRNTDNGPDLETVLEFLQERLGFLDGVVISGGEPTLNKGLPHVCRAIKELGCLVKLDTNGTRTEMLEGLIADKLIDYIALDIKAPLSYRDYLGVAGRLSREEFLNIRNSMYLLRKGPAHVTVEFRTTVVPVYHQAEDLLKIAAAIKGAELYTLQQFNPRQTLDPTLRTVKPYSAAELQELAVLVKQYVKRLRLINV